MSASVRIITLPYRSSFVPWVYVLSCCRPRIFLMLRISSLVCSCLAVASRTFNSFPLSGNTPKRSRFKIDNPEMANVLADRPSVRINVQSLLRAVPAILASSKFSTRTRAVFLPSVLFSSRISLCLTSAIRSSTNPSFIIFLTKSSLGSYRLPKSRNRVVSSVLVCDENAGLTIVARRNTNKLSLICAGLTTMFLCLSAIASPTLRTMFPVTASTCDPPRLV